MMGFFDNIASRGAKEIATDGPSPKQQQATERVDASSTRNKRISRGSLTPSLCSSHFLEDIKHEVMVNYLHQQQCSRMWMTDISGENEGVLVRKTKGVYMACPLQLRESALASAAAALNLQVWFTSTNVNP